MRRAPSSSSLSRAQSVTDDDLDELRGCLDPGFEFEPPAATGCAACIEGRTRLVETLPALDLYYAVAVKGGVPLRPARLLRLRIHTGERIFRRWIPVHGLPTRWGDAPSSWGAGAGPRARLPRPFSALARRPGRKRSARPWLAPGSSCCTHALHKRPIGREGISSVARLFRPELGDDPSHLNREAPRIVLPKNASSQLNHRIAARD
nr:uncharacterized protein LOC127312992 [Lolium perenne]